MQELDEDSRLAGAASELHAQGSQTELSSTACAVPSAHAHSCFQGRSFGLSSALQILQFHPILMSPTYALTLVPVNKQTHPNLGCQGSTGGYTRLVVW